jgi:hypothetical protein
MVEEAVTVTLRRLPLLLLALLGWLAFPSVIFAHRLDEYLQAMPVAIEPDGVRLQINLIPGVAVADQVLAQIDRDCDGVISKNESAAYAELLKHDLTLRLDGRNLALQLTASGCSAPAELRAGMGIIQVEFSVSPSQLGTGAHKLTVENRHLATISVHLFNATKPQSGLLQITGQKRNETQSMGEIEFTIQPPAANSSKASSIIPSLPALAELPGD